MSVRRHQGTFAAAVVSAVAITFSGCGVTPDLGSSGGQPPASAQPSPPASVPASPSTPKSASETTAEPSPSTSSASTSSAQTTATPAAKKKATKSAAILERGDQGEKVQELQHRLGQIDWFSGSITGNYDTSTVKSVAGFQGKRKIAQTGEVDRTTWNALTTMTRTPTKAERHNTLVAGPAILRAGSKGDRVRELQARLKQIGWFSGSVTDNYGSTTTTSVRGFQAKRGIPVTGEVDQRTLDRLNAMTRKTTGDELRNRVPKPSASGLDSRCLTGRAMCISKRNNSLVWVIDGKTQLQVDVRFGADRTPTREGTFSVGWKSRNHVSTIYHSAMPYAMFFSGGQAVHYSSDFAARGYNGASHGCVNVRNLSGIQTLFSQVRVGDKVIVYS